MPKRPRGHPRGDQRWSTFLKNHAAAILACDFFVAVTATFRVLYMFVVIEHGTRRLAHMNVTARPSAAWTLQQLREAFGDTQQHQYLIHDRDAIFAKHLDSSIRALGLEFLRSPLSSPKANAVCERLIGTIRRECLDWMIPMSEAHLRSILRRWVAHYNNGRPNSALGALAYPILHSNLDEFEFRNWSAGTDWPRARSCSPGRCWAVCITSTRLRPCRRARSPRRQRLQSLTGTCRGVRVPVLLGRRFCGAQGGTRLFIALQARSNSHVCVLESGVAGHPGFERYKGPHRARPLGWRAGCVGGH